jgi:hypothetical protein
MFATYPVLLSLQRYSAWRASQMLRQLEALRPGSSQQDFEAAVQHCDFETFNGDKFYVLAAYPYRFGRVWQLFWKLPETWSEPVWDGLHRLGLRAWEIRVHSTIQASRIVSVSVRVWVPGRYETLGSMWTMADHAMEFAGGGISGGNPPTLMHWYHITSNVSGEGYRISVTPRSSQEELRARHISSQCMLSFRGCDGLCELLPDAARLLHDRNSTFGGCTSTPKSQCELQNDNCRDSLTD